MKVSITEEHGETEALYGMSLSFYDGKTPPDKWWDEQQDKAAKRAKKLAHMDGGHNKFLEHIEVWMEVRAPLSWWKHADTYRTSSKQSESTMHTLKKRLPLTKKDFSFNVHDNMIEAFNLVAAGTKDISVLADNLPDGFLQTRIWKMSYKTLRNVVHQREGHRLGHWADFIQQVREQIEHPEYIWKEE